MEEISEKLGKGALSVKLCSVPVLRSCGCAVPILIQVRAEPQIQCLRAKSDLFKDLQRYI